MESLDSRGSRRLSRQLGLFASTLFLGAGVFSLPLIVPQVGLVAVFLGIGAIGGLSLSLYRRQADLFVDGSGPPGNRSLGASLERVGSGRSGRTLMTTGLGIYVGGAVVAYTLLGHAALLLLAGLLARSLESALLAGATAVAMIVTRRFLSLTQALARRLLGVGTTWLLGALSIRILPLGYSESNLALFAVFLAGVFWVGRPSGRVVDRGTGTNAILPEHSAPVVGLRIQLFLMAILAALILGLAPAHIPNLLPARGPDLAKISDALGVILFSFVGTGINCLSSYKSMAEPAFRRRVVDFSMMVTVLVQLAWLVLAVLVLDSRTLASLNSAGSNSAIGLELVVHGPAGAAVLLLGSLVSLIAVTNAASGFTASLAAELVAWAGSSTRPTARRAATRPGLIRVLLLLGAGAGAAAQVMTGDIAGHAGIDALLAVSGLAGGGILVFVGPVLAEERASARQGMAVLGLVVAAALGVWGSTLALSTSGWCSVVALFIVAWIPLLLTIVPAIRIWRSARVLETV